MAFDILEPGHNVWRIEQARRATVLVDGAAFFEAVRGACLKAQRSILIVGWDIDSRTRLVGGDGRPADGHAVEFAQFLAELVAARPELRIHLLLWDYSLLYAGERELLPRLSLDWRTPDRITLRLDNTVPFGSSQHQKIVVIDDAVALSGGLDLTIRRWDTPDHRLDNHGRVDPAGRPYRPFHDVQMMVDGEAARALALLARQRWCRVEGGEPVIEPFGDPWPESVAPDFTGVEIGIVRTQPRYNGDAEVREAEALFLDSIDRAERSIYIENQFVTSPLIARRLARQLRRQPGLEVVIVAPRSHDSWIERRTMRNGRIRFWRRLRAAADGRVRLLYPAVEQDGKATDTMIHSKIMVVDDRLLRVGSANLNNRSMGADTECDLAIEARNDDERAAIAAMRNRLLGEHCGVGAEEVAAALAHHGSLVAVADRLGSNGHRLRPIDDGVPDRSAFAAAIERMADPSRPVQLARVLHLPGRAALAAVAVGLLALAVVLAWHVTELSEIASPEQMADFLSASAGQPWAPALVLLAFLIGGAVALPVNILILATAAVFGPWLGLLYSSVGAASSALVMYWVGARFGQEVLGERLGPRWHRALARIRRRGVLAVFAIRVVPVAPFTVVNLAAGASAIGLADFLVGTALGMAPGLVLLSVVGDRIVQVFVHPSIGQIALLLACAVAWIALSFAAQAMLSRLKGRAS
jgi:phosphatidylserine/phosphatidylglycerophosphate/cardiolipin synthase-like enzyme/uncharacterized membrane protein YdjX (TVP38/TMEM64 family)